MQEGTPKQANDAATGSRGAFVWAWARDLTLSLILASLVILFIYQPVQVEGTSMMPALVDQERIFISKFTYQFGIEKSSGVTRWSFGLQPTRVSPTSSASSDCPATW